MSSSIQAVLLYAGWTLALLCGIAMLRATYSLTGRRAANAFAVGGDDVSAFSGRLCRAHANCYENLPVFAAIVLGAYAADSSAITDPLAMWVVAARIAQSIVHLWSTGIPAVALRFCCLLPQLAIQIWWLITLFGVAP
ncbi:MAG: MAPEG family protein [Lysobacteraceae bacterium]|nr:MAG: MAPEG family protein [Xanthomonadaceae bacterium]